MKFFTRKQQTTSTYVTNEFIRPYGRCLFKFHM